MRRAAAAAPRRESGSFQLSVAGRIEQRARAIQLVVDVCRAFALSADVEHSLVSAFGEAFNNVCMHSYRDCNGEVDIEVEVEPERLLMRLRDRGQGFDPATVRAPDLEALPEGGLGLFIMLRAMDEVRWYREGGENVVALVKRLRS
jgi:serine/threonine-protein kinase RsbW